jgi:microcystin-dependent protein
MSEPFIAEIRIFAGTFAPRGWAFCNGQLVSVSQNPALFSLVGTIYGGDGRTTFGLPDLRGRAPLHPGTGPGLTPRRLGEKAGAETATLTSSQMPSHDHRLTGDTTGATTGDPAGALPATVTPPPASKRLYRSSGTPASMNTNALAPVGGGGAHNNMQPYLVLNYIIALVGTFPSRN